MDRDPHWKTWVYAQGLWVLLFCVKQTKQVCAPAGATLPRPFHPCDTILCERGFQCIDGECVDVPCGEDECGPIPPVGPLECVDGSVIQPVVCERNDDGTVS